MLRKLGRLPVILAVVGAFLNSGDLLAEFQPEGRAFVGYVAAASVGIALYLCVEALLHHPHWSLLAGVAFFGLAEVSGQVLHAALVRSDVTVMTPALHWLMGYISPSLVVVAGVVMALILRYGFPPEGDDADAPLTRGDLARLEANLQSPVPLADILQAARNVPQPGEYVVDTRQRLLRKNGAAASAPKATPAPPS